MGERLPHAPRRRTGLVLLLVVVGLAVAGGIAYATIPDGSGVFHACVNPNNGNVRLIDPDKAGKAGHCKGKELAVTWNQTGPPGPPGTPGTPGAPGLSGLQTVNLASVSNSVSPKEAAVLCPSGRRVIGGG